MGETHSRGEKSVGLPNVAKKNLLARWQKRQCTQQFFAVSRHDERADGIYSFVNGERWTATEDFQKWPFDPPLSDAGIQAARKTGEHMKGILQASSCQLHVIVSSPYFRCIQTAVEMCLAIGPRIRLLIDWSLGEIYGPSIMGATEPRLPVRPLAHALSYCKRRGVLCYPKVIGKWPTWGENVRDARKRFASIFLTYLQRGRVTKRNFMVVGHADCVAASLSLMPSQAEHSIEKIEYGGMFFGTRSRKDQQPSKAGKAVRKPRSKGFASIVPGGENGDDSEALELDTPKLFLGSRAVESPWLNEEEYSLDEKIELPEASDAWEVCTSNIGLHKKAMRSSGTTRRSSFSKRVSSLAQNSSFSRERIEKLLGELSDAPLGTVAGEKLANDLEIDAHQEADARAGTQQTVPTICSFSTYLFGASEQDMSDIGSDFASRVQSFSDDFRIPSLKQISLDELPSPTWLSDNNRVHNLPNALLPMSVDKLLNRSPDKNSLTTLDEHYVKSSRSFRTDKCATLEKVDEQIGSLDFRASASESTSLDPSSNEVSMSSQSVAIEHGTGGLSSNLTNSSLFRRRKVKSTSTTLCQTSLVETAREDGAIAASVAQTNDDSSARAGKPSTCSYSSADFKVKEEEQSLPVPRALFPATSSGKTCSDSDEKNRSLSNVLNSSLLRRRQMKSDLATPLALH